MGERRGRSNERSEGQCRSRERHSSAIPPAGDRPSHDTRSFAIGLELADAVAWNPFARRFDSLARRVAAAQPDAVLLAGSAPPHVDSLLRDLRSRLGRGVALMASDGFAGLFGPNTRGMFIAYYGIPNAELPPPGKQFLAELEA